MAGGKIKREKPHRGGTPASANPHYQGGIPFHKSKGQHILKNPLLIDTIIEKSGIKNTDIILEIGPGTGNLTKKLLEAGKSVIAVEFDPRMVLELQRRFQGTAFSNRLKEVDVVTSCEESSPLGLRLTKTPSFLNLVEMKLSQARSKSCSNDQKPQDSVHDTRMDDFVPQPMSDREKLKASNFPALLLKIGSWERLTRKEGDLLAKCYYAKRKIVWEVLEGTLKSKIEIQWADIEAIRAIIRDDEPGILEIELKQSPLFFQEINPQPRKHTIWNEAPDFTGGQARIYRRHLVKFPPGTLDKHYEKLLQSDDHLLELSQRPFPSLNSPYFSSNNIYGVSNIPFDFPSCNSPFPLPTIPPSLVPAHQLQNFKLSPGQTFGTMSSSDSPMSVTNCAWREDNIIDSAFDNPWMDPNTGLLIDLENNFLSESQNEWSDERKLIARLRSMCQPFQEVNPENRIGMHQLEYNQEAFYDDQSIVGGDEAFEVDGGLTNPQPIGWLSPQIFYENQMMNFLSENSLYQYDLSQQKVMDYAATGVGHEVDRWR